jgi:rRNA maturation endonuclease Nob1
MEETKVSVIYTDGKGKYKYKNNKKKWLNCVNCGKEVNDRKYHFCGRCYRQWIRKNL